MLCEVHYCASFCLHCFTVLLFHSCCYFTHAVSNTFSTHYFSERFGRRYSSLICPELVSYPKHLSFPPHLTPSLLRAAYATVQTFYWSVIHLGTKVKKRKPASRRVKRVKLCLKLSVFLACSATKMCVSPLRLRGLKAILKAEFPIFVGIMQVLMSVFAYSYQATNMLNLCCHGNTTDKCEIWLKMTNFTAVFCGCDPCKGTLSEVHTRFMLH